MVGDPIPTLGASQAAKPSGPDSPGSGSPGGGKKSDDTRAWRILAVPLACLAAIALFLILTGEPPQPPPPPESPRTVIRVLLIKSAPEIKLELNGAWLLVPFPAESGDAIPVKDLGEVTLSAAGWSLEGEASTQLPDVSEIRIEPAVLVEGPDPKIGLEGRTYRGALWIRRSESGQLRVVSGVNLEDYLAGVIGHEMPLSWHDEAVKAQAIAARTYVLRERRPKRHYDVERDTRSQVYGGVMRTDARAQAMVRATKGLVVTHEGRMVTTYFHSTCGGDTIPASWVFRQVKRDTPPLMGASDCTCQPSKYYRFETQVDFRKIKQVSVALPLKSLEVTHWPRGNYVRQLILVGAEGKEQRWHGYSQARSYLRLKAPAFTATLDEDGLGATFKSRGWGHGVGMCQFGANGFAKQGYDAAQIMRHFYPKTELTQYTPDLR